jgi:hypothetical protein
MTDRIHSLTVVLDANYRDDDVKALIAAIAQLRGVIDVSTHVADVTSHMAEKRARNELQDKIRDLLWPESKP